jgi:MYXO-CTERM domain-containing protein
VGEALSAASGGDTVLLHDGYYGDVTMEGEFSSETTLKPRSGAAARLRTLHIQSAQNLTVQGLSISLSHADSYSDDTMVEISGSDVTLADCDIFSVPDSETSGWSASDWANRPGSGIQVSSPDITLRDNTVRNIGYGITVGYSAVRAHVVGNVVSDFSRDGIRGLSDDSVFEYNLVKNSYDVDDHHDDFFQSWSYTDSGGPGSGVVSGVVLRGNKFIAYEDPDQPFAGAAQGIGCFDGFFEGWTVENNVILVNHWHGITFLGARDMTIVNNTVLDAAGGDPGPPWIKVAPHKDGSSSSGITMANNLAQSIQLDARDSEEVSNIVYDDASSLFVDPAGHDLHLQDGASPIDAADSMFAPSHDRDRIPRPQGDGPDVGAYEWHDGSVEPEDPVGGSDGGMGSDPDAGTGSGSGDPDAGSSNGDDDDGGDDDGGDDGAGAGMTDAGAPMEGTADAGVGGMSGGSYSKGTGTGCSVGSDGSVPSGALWVLLALGALGPRRRRR